MFYKNDFISTFIKKFIYFQTIISCSIRRNSATIRAIVKMKTPPNSIIYLLSAHTKIVAIHSISNELFMNLIATANTNVMNRLVCNTRGSMLQGVFSTTSDLSDNRGIYENRLRRKNSFSSNITDVHSSIYSLSKKPLPRCLQLQSRKPPSPRKRRHIPSTATW